MAPEILVATSCACAGFFIEEKRVMQQSRDKYFPQLENQCINPVGDNAQITNTCTNNQTTCTQRDKGGCQSLHGHLQN